MPAERVRPALDDRLRDEWGRLLALLVAQYRRLDLAEDGLADAFEAAARTWPRDGVPDQPRRVAAHRRPPPHRRPAPRGGGAARTLPRLVVEAELQEEAQHVMADAGRWCCTTSGSASSCCAPTRCSRPSPPPRSPCGWCSAVSTADIARLFLVPTPTMAARLTRARQRVAGETFALPVGPRPRRARRHRGAGRLPRVHRRLRPGIRRGRAAQRRVGRGDPAGPGAARGGARRAELDALLALMLLQHSRRRRPGRRDGGWCCCPTRTGRCGSARRSTRRSRC